MPRSASDATRFTSTGPFISAKPPGSNIQLGGSAPPNETGQAKIARLRAAAAQARAGSESQFDKVVRVGRTWADRAHRFTTWSLIGLTVICFAGASFATGDMIMHNRRKRGEWLAEQQAKSIRDLQDARKAAATGVANDDQILLLNRERAAREADEAKKSQKGIFTRAKESVFGGLSEEEQKGGKIGAAARAVQEKVQEAVPKSVETPGVLKAVEQKVEETKQSGKAVLLHPTGGPLDRQAEVSWQAVKSGPSGWTSWLTGR